MWAAAVIPVAAYLIRSFARGWDFSLDMPIDALLGGLLVALIALTLWVRGPAAPDDSQNELPTQMDHQHDAESDER